MFEDESSIEIEDEEHDENPRVQDPRVQDPRGGPSPQDEEEFRELAPGDALREAEEKYLRLYAEFDNYKKRVAREKSDLMRYAHEALLFELLTSLDNLDTALVHADEGSAKKSAAGLKEGVEMTLRELLRTLKKAGLEPIEALGEPFNPEVHHAISRLVRDDVAEGTVVEEMRKGYMYQDRVLRASMVAVSGHDRDESEEDDEDMTEDPQNNGNTEDTKEEF